MMRMRRNRIYLALLLLAILLPAISQAADRLYFSSMVEHDEASVPGIISIWGALEGNIPDEITTFLLYRRHTDNAYSLIAELPNTLASVQEIGEVISNDPNEQRFVKLLASLEQIRSASFAEQPPVTKANFAPFLRALLEPASPDFNPLQRMLLCRINPAVAQVAGLAYRDAGPFDNAKIYSYMLTAVTSSGESLPIGQSAELDPGSPNILPAPIGLRQTFVATGCADLRNNLDDLRIHLNWDPPATPAAIGQNILTYGYDLFWATEELLNLDLNREIPDTLHRVNSKPIVVAGPTTISGPDNYLARDSKENHNTGPAWQRGQEYFYYLAAIDIGGHYSQVSGPVVFTVTDRQPPHGPWRVHTEETAEIITGVSTPQLSLVWDQVNPQNYIRYFGVGSDRVVCSSDDSSVCTAPSTSACNDPARLRCIDLDVSQYRIFRFPSAEAATSWGQNELCDPGNDPQWLIATIDQDDSSRQRQLTASQTQIVFNDTADDHENNLTSDNYDQVFYYRVVAVDSVGNYSPISPPIRGVINNRSQPTVSAHLASEDCDNFSAAIDSSTAYYQEGDLLTLIDNSGKAAEYVLMKYCDGTPTHIQTNLSGGGTIISRGYVDGHVTHLSVADLIEPYGCENTGCTSGNEFSLYFIDQYGQIMTATAPFSMADLCATFSGTVTLEPDCYWASIIAPSQVAEGNVQICVDLTEGQSARIYQQIDGEMSPLATVPFDPDPDNGDQSCVEIENLGSLQGSDICLGARTFSENHIGSAMFYFDCLEMMQSDGAPPRPPLLEGIYSRGEGETSPSFAVNWSAAVQNQAAFVYKLSTGTRSYHKTLFNMVPGTSGQFSHIIDLDPATDLDQEWCVSLRVIDSTMQKSRWSEKQCATWTSSIPEYLPWPNMTEPEELGTIAAFFINEGTSHGRPALLLSDNLSSILSVLPCDGQYCGEYVPDCDGSSICVDRQEAGEEILDEATVFEHEVSLLSGVAFNPCNFIKPRMKLKHFLVYRQEEGRDFVQTSPMIEPFSCEVSIVESGFQQQQQLWKAYITMQDPFIFLRDFSPTAITIDGTNPTTGAAMTADMVSGTRLFYLDRYPSVSGTKVRYKVVLMNPVTGEPRRIATSNWLSLP